MVKSIYRLAASFIIKYSDAMRRIQYFHDLNVHCTPADMSILLSISLIFLCFHVSFH